MGTQSNWVEAAARVARRLHDGQKDKAGMDYFEGHLRFVASLGRTWQEQVVGLYEKLGFQTVSEPFILASTPHVKMIYQK